MPALEKSDPIPYERSSVTVDVVLLGLFRGHPAALLLKRDQEPFADHWALPGGFLDINETLNDAAWRVLRDKIGITDAHLEQLYTFDYVDGDPRMRIITVAYLALLDDQAFADALARAPHLLSAGIEVPWQGETGGPITALSPSGEPLSLAFDHADILALAILRLRGKLDYSDVGFALLPEHFTLRQLQDVHETILGTTLNKPAFRRRMLDKGWIAATGTREAGTSYRPAELFRFERSK